MASGSFSASIVSGHYKLQVNWTSTPDTATNTSSVVVAAQLINDWSLEVGSRTVTNVINGSTQTYEADGIHSTGTHDLGSVTQEVAHNSDGSKSITVQVTYPIRATIRDTYYSEIVASQSITLDNIPRQSTISSVTSNVTVGSSGGVVNVAINRNNAAFTHTVVYAFGSNSTTHTSVGTSDSYTIPASWLSYIPNSATGTATVTVTTYNSGTQIGSAVSTTFTITAGVNPTIGSVTVAPRGTAYSAGITSVYINGYSTALITASSVSGANGSTISKVEFIKDGTVLSSNTTPTYTYTTGTLTGSSATFSVRVTDSRGRTGTTAASAITIKAYAVPAFSATSIYRSNSGGTADASGTYCYIKTTATATPTENSISSLTYATKLTSASSYGAETTLTNSTAKIASGFAATSSYDIRIKATDELGKTSYFYGLIPTETYTMDFKVGGLGVAFGKVAETDNCVDSAWQIKAPSIRINSHDILEIH